MFVYSILINLINAQRELCRIMRIVRVGQYTYYFIFRSQIHKPRHMNVFLKYSVTIIDRMIIKVINEVERS